MKAFRLMVNRSVAWAEWDDDLLGLELLDLKSLYFDLGLTGFDEPELVQLLAAQDANDGLCDEDTVPPAPQTLTSKAGDLWLLGHHRLLCGDSTDQQAVTHLVTGQAIRFSSPKLPRKAAVISGLSVAAWCIRPLGANIDDGDIRPKEAKLVVFSECVQTARLQVECIHKPLNRGGGVH